MDELEPGDVPYGNNWDSDEEAAAYGAAADGVRPWRADMRRAFAQRVEALGRGTRVLELGPGPGLLAECVLQHCPNVASYTVLDFSAPMLALCRKRLTAYPAARFVQASFKQTQWPEQIEPPVDCVLTMQAVHELRHKRHAVRLFRQVREVLAPGGVLLVCDHLPLDESVRSSTLYMTTDEQCDALTRAGFLNVRVDHAINGLTLYAGEKSTHTASGACA